MKVLVIGDLQIEATDSGSPRAEQTRNTLSWVLSELDQHRPDMAVHLGDFGENNKGVDHYSLTLMMWFVSEACRRVPQSYWLVGNHDYYTDDGGVNLMTALRYLMPENHRVAWPWETGPEGTLFVSYLKSGMKERFRAEVGLLFSEKEKCVMFSHLPVNGAMFGPGRFEENGLDPTWLPSQTIVGHYHKPNPPDPNLAAFGNAIWYAGSPMSHDFRDNCYGLTPEQQLRGIWLFEIADGQVQSAPTFLENPYAHYFLSLSASVEYDASHNSAIVHDEWFNNHCRLPLDRTTVKITVPAGQEESAQVVFGQTAQSAMVLREDQHAATVEAGTIIDPDASPSQAVTEYVDGLSANKLQGLDAGTLKQTGVSLVEGQYALPQGDGDASQTGQV